MQILWFLHNDLFLFLVAEAVAANISDPDCAIRFTANLQTVYVPIALAKTAYMKNYDCNCPEVLEFYRKCTHGTK
jgi:hypothetical protein